MVFLREGAKFPVLITPHGFHLSGIDSCRKGILRGIFHAALSSDGLEKGMPVVIYTKIDKPPACKTSRLQSRLHAVNFGNA